MSLLAGFAEIDITPPVGAHKIGWLKDIVADRILDPLYARAAIFESDGRRVGFVQLDTLSIRWGDVSEIRQRIAKRHDFPGGNVMVAATHNHAGPAVANCGDVPRDEAYVEKLTEKVVAVFGDALANREEAEIGFGSCFEFEVAHNRRVIMRDGTVRTHGTFDDPDALCLEGPIDPEVAVMATRKKDGELLGAAVNFACHPTHHGPDSLISAGFPGVLAREMKSRGCPVTLYLNGASGNLNAADPCKGSLNRPMEQVGQMLAGDVSRALESAAFTGRAVLGSRSSTVGLPFRSITPEEIEGKTRGAQRFVDPAIYERHMAEVIERIRREGTQQADVQVIFINQHVYVGIPAEYFVQDGLRIKEGACPRHALVVGHANGMVGYVPHRAAFLRGGYETTFCNSSRLAPEAGEMLADCALELVAEGPGP